MNKKYQVFVSSTYSDLKQERQACVEAILTAGHIPAGMELFSAGSESQLEIIKRWIDDSDIYMLLLGGRYGSIEPGSGLSYTEIEYRYALENEKPVFALLMDDSLLDDKVKGVGRDVLEMKNQQKYDDFRRLVLSRISKFFQNEDQLKLGVIQSLLDIDKRYKLNGWVKANESVDSIRVLNQISELSARNKELEAEIETWRENTNFTSHKAIIESLTDEAKSLLAMVSEDKYGDIRTASEGFTVKIGGKKYPLEHDSRMMAAQEHGFKQLILNELISSIGSSSDGDIVYRITKIGYDIADKLNSEKTNETTSA